MKRRIEIEAETRGSSVKIVAHVEATGLTTGEMEASVHDLTDALTDAIRQKCGYVGGFSLREIRIR